MVSQKHCWCLGKKILVAITCAIANVLSQISLTDVALSWSPGAPPRLDSQSSRKNAILLDDRRPEGSVRTWHGAWHKMLSGST